MRLPPGLKQSNLGKALPGEGEAGVLLLGSGAPAGGEHQQPRAGRGARHRAAGGAAAPGTTGRCYVTSLYAVAPPQRCRFQSERSRVRGLRKCPSAAGCPCPARIHLLPEEPPGRVPGPDVGPGFHRPATALACGPQGTTALCLNQCPFCRHGFYCLGVPAVLTLCRECCSPGWGQEE